MVKKMLCCAMLMLLAASGALAEPYLFSCHYSLADLTDGHSDYSQARFYRVYLNVEDDSISANQTYIDAEGTMTLSGGTYSYTNEQLCKAVSGSSKTFPLKSDGMRISDDYLLYVPVNDDGDSANFVLSADSGLNGVNVSWTFPTMQSLNGQGTVSSFRTTEQQLASFVPYVEYIRSGSNVTGIRWRVVSSSDVTAPVSQDFRMRVRIRSVWKKGYDSIYSGSWTEIPAGQTPEGTAMFDSPVAESEIWGLRIRLYTYEGSAVSRYEWRYFVPSVSEPDLWTNHVSTASLVDGKPDYSTAKFYGLAIDPRTDRLAEAKYFTDAGRMTIPGGGYSFRYDSSNVSGDAGNVASGTTKTFELRMYRSYITDEVIEYSPVDDTGTMVMFSGGAERGLNGRTITWTFPSDLNMSGSAVIPPFRSVNEQLSQGVPYVELVTSGGNITGVNYRIVTSGDTSRALTPSYDTDFRIYLDHTTGYYYDSEWQEKHHSGTWTLSEPQTLSTLRRVRVRFITYEDSNNPCIYQWNFTPASSGTPSGGGSSGGCEAGFAFASVVILAAFMKKR